MRLRNRNKFKKCKKFQRRKRAILDQKNNMKEIAEAELKMEDEKYNLTKLKLSIQCLNDKTNGKQNNLWKIKNSFCPKLKSSVPVAKRNLANQIITNPCELKRVFVNHFKHRMRKRPMLPKFKKYEIEIEKRFNEIL